MRIHRNRALGGRALVAFVAGAVLTQPSIGFTAACSARSGPQTTALVELYTSEGCDSCPPADRWLSTSFRPGAAAAGAVALAFHVDYWDRLGWNDRFASAAYTERQYDVTRTGNARFAYTPQVVLQGRDFPDWHGTDTLDGDRGDQRAPGAGKRHGGRRRKGRRDRRARHRGSGRRRGPQGCRAVRRAHREFAGVGRQGGRERRRAPHARPRRAGAAGGAGRRRRRGRGHAAPS